MRSIEINFLKNSWKSFFGKLTLFISLIILLIAIGLFQSIVSEDKKDVLGATLREVSEEVVPSTIPSRKTNNFKHASMVLSPSNSTLNTTTATSTSSDNDGDGFSNELEAFLGTDANKECANTSTANDEQETDGWPLDFNDDQRVNTIDVGRFVFVLNSQTGDGRYNARYDLNMDGNINNTDIEIFQPFLNKTCVAKGLELISVTPHSGPAGQEITITGTSFGNEAGSVIFCTSHCDYGGPIESWSDSEIKSRVPGMIAQAGTFEFYVMTKAGQSSNRLPFTVTAGQPVINSISPMGAKTGEQITLSGTSFGDTNGQIRFYDNYPNIAGVGSIVSWSDTQMSLTIPSTLINGSEYAIQIINSGGAESSVKFYILGN